MNRQSLLHCIALASLAGMTATAAAQPSAAADQSAAPAAATPKMGGYAPDVTTQTDDGTVKPKAPPPKAPPHSNGPMVKQPGTDDSSTPMTSRTTPSDPSSANSRTPTSEDKGGM